MALFSLRRHYKKGVEDRINELADFEVPRHPAYRPPPYLHLMPLAEIIQMALGHASVQTKGVKPHGKPL